MTYSVSYDDENQMVICKAEGQFSWEFLDHFIPEVSNYLLEKKTRLVLVDFSNFLVHLSTIEIYRFYEKIENIYKNQGIDVRKLRRAYLVNLNDEDFQFFETISVNNNYQLKLFTDFEQAVNWLTA